MSPSPPSFSTVQSMLYVRRKHSEKKFQCWKKIQCKQISVLAECTVESIINVSRNLLQKTHYKHCKTNQIILHIST